MWYGCCVNCRQLNEYEMEKIITFQNNFCNVTINVKDDNFYFSNKYTNAFKVKIKILNNSLYFINKHGIVFLEINMNGIVLSSNGVCPKDAKNASVEDIETIISGRKLLEELRK